MKNLFLSLLTALILSGGTISYSAEQDPELARALEESARMAEQPQTNAEEEQTAQALAQSAAEERQRIERERKEQADVAQAIQMSKAEQQRLNFARAMQCAQSASQSPHIPAKKITVAMPPVQPAAAPAKKFVAPRAQKTIQPVQPQPAPSRPASASVQPMQGSVASKAKALEAQLGGRKMSQGPASKPKAPARPAPTRPSALAQQPKPKTPGVRQRAAALEAERNKQVAQAAQEREDARLAQEYMAVQRAAGEPRAAQARREQERKQEAHNKIIEYVPSHPQKGADCGYWAVLNAMHGGDRDYQTKQAPIEEWRKLIMALGHGRENISDGDIEYLLKTKFAARQNSVTIIPNVLQLQPITDQTPPELAALCPESYTAAMEKLQTQRNAEHAFIVGTAQQIGDKGTKGGHWIAIRAVKKGNTITWYVQDSGGEGTNKPIKTAEALINFIMHSDFEHIRLLRFQYI